jgi:hypothetical protein
LDGGLALHEPAVLKAFAAETGGVFGAPCLRIDGEPAWATTVSRRGALAGRRAVLSLRAGPAVYHSPDRR